MLTLRGGISSAVKVTTLQSRKILIDSPNLRCLSIAFAIANFTPASIFLLYPQVILQCLTHFIDGNSILLQPDF